MFCTRQLAILLVFFIQNSYAQTVQDDLNTALHNPVILKHYSADDLTALSTTDSLKLKTIVYYYTQSYILTPIQCSDCLQPDITKFDVSKYERFREKSTAYVRDYDKFGYRLTLIAIDDLIYKMPMHTP